MGLGPGVSKALFQGYSKLPVKHLWGCWSVVVIETKHLESGSVLQTIWQQLHGEAALRLNQSLLYRELHIIIELLLVLNVE